MELCNVSLLFLISGLSITVDAHSFSSLMKFGDTSDDNGSTQSEKISSEPGAKLRRLGRMYRQGYFKQHSW